jgi:hypothetical protein
MKKIALALLLTTSAAASSWAIPTTPVAHRGVQLRPDVDAYITQTMKVDLSAVRRYIDREHAEKLAEAFDKDQEKAEFKSLVNSYATIWLDRMLEDRLSGRSRTV